MGVIFTEMVRRYYTEHRPLAAEALGTLQETEDFFRSLGAQIEEKVQQGEDQIAGSAPVGETYLQHVGRLRMARAQAQEIALADLLYSNPPETEEHEEETSEQGQQLLQLRREMNEAMVLLTEQLDAEMARQLQQLRPRPSTTPRVRTTTARSSALRSPWARCGPSTCWSVCKPGRGYPPPTPAGSTPPHLMRP